MLLGLCAVGLFLWGMRRNWKDADAHYRRVQEKEARWQAYLAQLHAERERERDKW